MPYATPSELGTAFGAHELAQMATPHQFDIVDAADLEATLGDPAFPDGKPNETALDATLAVINQALAVADGLVDSYLGARYTLPLAIVPAVLREVALDLARYEMHKEKATEEVRNRRDQAVAWLKDISSGKATLGAPSIDSGSQGAGIRIQESAGRTFTAETLGAFGASV